MKTEKIVDSTEAGPPPLPPNLVLLDALMAANPGVTANRWQAIVPEALRILAYVGPGVAVVECRTRQVRGITEADDERRFEVYQDGYSADEVGVFVGGYVELGAHQAVQLLQSGQVECTEFALDTGEPQLVVVPRRRPFLVLLREAAATRDQALACGLVVDAVRISSPAEAREKEKLLDVIAALVAGYYDKGGKFKWGDHANTSAIAKEIERHSTFAAETIRKVLDTALDTRINK